MSESWMEMLREWSGNEPVHILLILVLRLIIILTALALIVPIIITPTRENVLALLGALALSIGFAIKDYISCLIAGIIFMFERPDRVGDWIQIGETYGEVIVTEFYVHPDHNNALARQALFDVAMTSVYLHLDRPIVVVMKNLPLGMYYKLKAYPMEAREQFKFIADLTERGQFALQEIGLRLVTAPTAVAGHV